MTAELTKKVGSIGRHLLGICCCHENEVSIADLSEVTSNNAGHGPNGLFIQCPVHFIIEKRLGVTG